MVLENHEPTSPPHQTPTRKSSSHAAAADDQSRQEKARFRVGHAGSLSTWRDALSTGTDHAKDAAVR